MELIYSLCDGRRYLPESVELDERELNNLIISSNHKEINIEDVLSYKMKEEDYLDEICGMPNRTILIGRKYDYNDRELCVDFDSHAVEEVYFKKFCELPFLNLFVKSTDSVHKINIESCDIGKLIVNKVHDNKPMKECRLYIKNSFVGQISLGDNLYVFSDDRAIIKDKILTRKVCIKERYGNTKFI